jgi:peptide/nickel transport system permease protein
MVSTVVWFELQPTSMNARHLLREVLRLLVTIWLALTLVFVLLKAMPGNVLTAQLQESGANAETIAAAAKQFGIDKPLLVQYVDSLLDIARGEFGRSLSSGIPVVLLLQQRVTSSLTMVGIAFVISSSTALFVVMLSHQRSLLFQRMVDAACAVIFSLPPFWIGTLLLIVNTSTVGVSQSSLLLPVTVLSIQMTSLILITLRQALASLAGEPHVVFARSKGLPEHVVFRHHLLPLAIMTAITVISNHLAVLMGSTVSVEVLFGQPGLGSLLLKAVLERDYFTAQGAVVVIVVLASLFTFAARIITSWIDPRIGSTQ